MKPGDHLRPEIAFGYRNQLLTPEELRAADAHIAACERCREQLAAEMDVAGMAASVREALLESLHEESGAAPARRRYLPWMAGALAAVAAAAVFLLLRPAPDLFPGVHDRSSAAVTADQRRAVETALRSGRLPVPPSLTDLVPRHEVLMGGTVLPKEQVELLTPAATVVLSKRPTFRWKPLDGEWTYTVRIFRPSFEIAAESPAVAGSEWTPAQDLAPAIIYEWQVEARRGAEHSVYPLPPQTPPQFRVAEDRDAVALRRLAEQNPPRMVLAIEYARAGLVEDAERELSALLRDNPQSPELRRLLDSLNRNH